MSSPAVVSDELNHGDEVAADDELNHGEDDHVNGDQAGVDDDDWDAVLADMLPFSAGDDLSQNGEDDELTQDLLEKK